MLVRHERTTTVCFYLKKSKMKTKKSSRGRERKIWMYFFSLIRIFSFSLLETIDDDEGDRKDENDESSDEKSNLRISQPKYSQLLKELDFSQARMVKREKTSTVLTNK